MSVTLSYIPKMQCCIRLLKMTLACLKLSYILKKGAPSWMVCWICPKFQCLSASRSGQLIALTVWIAYSCWVLTWPAGNVYGNAMVLKNFGREVRSLKYSAHQFLNQLINMCFFFIKIVTKDLVQTLLTKHYRWLAWGVAVILFNM